MVRARDLGTMDVGVRAGAVFLSACMKRSFTGWLWPGQSPEPAGPVGLALCCMQPFGLHNPGDPRGAEGRHPPLHVSPAVSSGGGRAIVPQVCALGGGLSNRTPRVGRCCAPIMGHQSPGGSPRGRQCVVFPPPPPPPPPRSSPPHTPCCRCFCVCVAVMEWTAQCVLRGNGRGHASVQRDLCVPRAA